LLVGGDWNHGILWLSILGIYNNPNWPTPSFFRGVGQPPTRLGFDATNFDRKNLRFHQEDLGFLDVTDEW
jgi:hypothetical protein